MLYFVGNIECEIEENYTMYVADSILHPQIQF